MDGVYQCPLNESITIMFMLCVAYLQYNIKSTLIVCRSIFAVVFVELCRRLMLGKDGKRTWVSVAAVIGE